MTQSAVLPSPKVIPCECQSDFCLLRPTLHLLIPILVLSSWYLRLPYSLILLFMVTLYIAYFLLEYPASTSTHPSPGSWFLLLVGLFLPAISVKIVSVFELPVSAGPSFWNLTVTSLVFPNDDVLCSLFNGNSFKFYTPCVLGPLFLEFDLHFQTIYCLPQSFTFIPPFKTSQ